MCSCRKNNHRLIKIDWDELNQIPTLDLWRKETPQKNSNFHFCSLLLYIDNPSYSSIDFHAFQSDYKLFKKRQGNIPDFCVYYIIDCSLFHFKRNFVSKRIIKNILLNISTDQLDALCEGEKILPSENRETMSWRRYAT